MNLTPDTKLGIAGIAQASAALLIVLTICIHFGFGVGVLCAISCFLFARGVAACLAARVAQSGTRKMSMNQRSGVSEA